MARTPLLLLLLAVLACTVHVRGEDDDGDEAGGEAEGEDDEDESDEKGVDGVKLNALFPQHASAIGQPRLGAGEQVPTLVAFDNAADSQSYKVEFIRAHLASTMQPDFIVQNMTGQLYNRTIERGETATLAYTFQPSKEVEPRDYTLVVQVWFHEGEDEAERTTLAAFNSTVTIVDASSGIDFQLILLTATLGGVGFCIYMLVTKGKKKKVKSTPAPVAAKKAAGDSDKGTQGSGVSYDDEWIPQTHKKSRSSSGGRAKSPKK